MVMSSRDFENFLLNKALLVAKGNLVVSVEEREANVFYFLSRLVKDSELKENMSRLELLSKDYFKSNPDKKMTYAELQNSSWFLGMPRFKNMFLQKMRISNSKSKTKKI